MNDAAKTEYELKRLDHYKTRFQEHQRSLEVSKKEVDKLRGQYEQILQVNHNYQPLHFAFLTDIAKLIVAARRAISFTYGIRYYLKGKNK